MTFKKIKIAVTGSAGFVGSHLVKRLNELDADIIHLDIKNGIDITDWEQIKNIGNFDLLFHLAAKLYIPDSYENPLDFYHTNIVSTMNVLELCRTRKAKIIFTSTYVYGVPQYLPIDENHLIVAFNPYTQSKIICEQLCKSYNRDFDLNVIIFRPFNIYGNGQNFKFLIPTIINQAKKGRIILKDPLPKRDFIYIEDIINVYTKTILYNKTGFEVFNIGSGISYSVKEIAETIASNSENTNIEIKFSGERRQNEVMNTVADISKAKKLLGWEPNINLSDGIKYIISGKQ